jgi:hydrogenase small subunit
MFAENFDDAGSKAGWCLYKLGCRGPETYNSCGNMRWFQGMSYPIQSGAPCIGCSNAHFWDEGPLTERLPKFAPSVDVDTIGAGLAAVTAVGVAAHGAASVVQKKKRIAAEQAEKGAGEE